MKISELGKPINNATKIFQLLRLKYKDLNAELHICSRYGYAPIDANPFLLFEKIPSIFVDSRNRKEALIVFDMMKGMADRNKLLKSEFIQNQIEIFKIRVRNLIESLDIDEETTIEICFRELKYELVWALQKDLLVDHKLTLQSKSSIKIVLGSIRSLAIKNVIVGERNSEPNYINAELKDDTGNIPIDLLNSFRGK